MTYIIQYSKSAQKAIEKFRKSNKPYFKKFEKLIRDIHLHPREGLGHPEPLVGGNDELYSRHIDKRNRILYQIKDECVLVLVLEVEGHYSDK